MDIEYYENYTPTKKMKLSLRSESENSQNWLSVVVNSDLVFKGNIDRDLQLEQNINIREPLNIELQFGIQSAVEVCVDIDNDNLLPLHQKHVIYHTPTCYLHGKGTWKFTTGYETFWEWWFKEKGLGQIF